MSELEAKAMQWMLDHPEAMKLYEDMALQAAQRSRKFGVKFLTERIRWEFRIVRDDPGFKINNNHTAYIARELIRMQAASGEQDRVPTHTRRCMNIRSFSGEDAISEICTAAMSATIWALVKDGFITEEDANKFIGRHIAVLTSKESWWDRVRKHMGWANDSDVVAILEVK